MNSVPVHRRKRYAAPWLIPGFLVFAWGAADQWIASHPFYLPPLTSVLRIVVHVDYARDLLHTGYRVGIGFGTAAVLGIASGVMIGLNKNAYALLKGLMEFFRALPATALFPLFILFFGIGDAAKIAITIFICFWIIQIHTIYGVWSIDRLTLNIGKIYNATKPQLITRIVLPGALPHIAAGLKVSLSLALIVVVVTEMFIGTRFGLGQKIYDSYITFNIANLYAYIIVVGTLGLVLNKAFDYLETKYIHWRGR